jgi:hypothetical protein
MKLPHSDSHRSWPLYVLAAPATVAVWSGWVGLGEMTGFGKVHPLPGIADGFSLNTAITLPIGVEAYAAYALGAWLTKKTLSEGTRRFARLSALGALALGALGQIAYHLLEVSRHTHAPLLITTLVACLPVAVLGMGATLAHLIHRDGGEDMGAHPRLRIDLLDVMAHPVPVSSPRHTICSGPRGVLFLRRPLPKATPRHMLSTVLAGDEGSQVADVADYLGGQHSPVVYFVVNGDRVKIGTTQSLRNRIRRLCLRVDDIALVLHGAQDYERRLHERFAPQRVGDSEWFELAGDLAAFVSTGGDHLGALPVANSASSTGDSERQDGPLVGDSSDVSAVANSQGDRAPERQQRRTPAVAKKAANGRRSMDEWVELATPIFHAEFERLQRQPTGYEFAAAIKRAKLGSPSPSTAKNIRSEILDRAPLPSLD